MVAKLFLSTGFFLVGDGWYTKLPGSIAVVGGHCSKMLGQETAEARSLAGQRDSL